MIALSLFLACTGSETPPAAPPSETPKPEAPPVAQDPAALPEDLSVGVREVVTPPEILRLADRVQEVPNRRLEVRADFEATSFTDLHARLTGWGFSVTDGDGQVLRVLAPAGERWAERLEPLRSVARVTETLSQDTLADGRLRGGSARFGTATYTWGIQEGGLVEKLDGAALPPKPALPRTVPVSVVRCLAPLHAAMLDGETAGPGWERALVLEPLGWAIVLENYGPCQASGYIRADFNAKTDNLTVAGKSVRELDEASLFAAASRYLSVERAGTDEWAVGAVDILRRADDAVLVQAITDAAPGVHQERLLLALAERGEDKALEFARTSASPTVKAWAAGVDSVMRTSVMADPKAPAEALLTSMSAWRPASTDTELLTRLKAHADPRVRERAWELDADASTSACMGRMAGAKTLDLAGAQALYKECIQQPVRLQAFGRVNQLDKAAANSLVEGTLKAPETVRAGIGAVRAANALMRDDLLEAVVANPAVDRDTRAEALRTLGRAGRSTKVDALVEAHGAFLGVKAVPRDGVADEGGRKKRGGR